MRTLIFLSLMLIPHFSTAADRSEKLATLIQLYELQESLDQQMAAYAAQFPSIMGSAMKELDKDFDLGADELARIRELSRRYEASYFETISGLNYLTEFSKIFGPQFTDAELDELIAFQSSPLGRKSTKVGNEANLAVSQILGERLSVALGQSVEAFNSDLKKLLEECNCVRTKVFSTPKPGGS